MELGVNMKLNNDEAKKLKKDFPIFRSNPELIYLDSAATSQKPKKVIDAISQFYENENANAGRSIHSLAEKSLVRYDESRATVANFINAEKNEIVFTKNATDSFNLLAHAIFPLISEGKDEILLTEMEHHSNIVPWQELAKRHGLKIKYVKIRDNYTLDLADMKKKLTRKTAIFSLTYVSNVLGTANPIKEICEMIRRRGALSVIDASQAVAHTKIDVKRIDCDFLAFSSHKMYGPTGIGVLYGKKEFLDKMQPVSFGGGMIKKVGLDSTEFADMPEKFESGTQNIADAVGLAEAIKYLEGLGLDNIKKWETELLAYALRSLKEIEGVKVYNPGAEKSSSTISFTLDGIHPHDVAELLNKDGIAIRAGHMCAMPLIESLGLTSKGGLCRASFSFYNTFEDIDALTKSLKKINEKFKGIQ